MITVDGRRVGIVSFTTDDEPPEITSPDFGSEHEGGDWQSSLDAPEYDSAYGSKAGPRGAQAYHGDKASTGDRAEHKTHRGQPGAVADSGAGEGLSGSAYLAARRERFAQEMRADPALRERVAAMMITEGARDPVPVVESLMNRMDYSGGTLGSGLTPRFYGPMRRGELPAAVAEMRRNPALQQRMDRAIDAALAGSNTIRGATDQGLPTDPNGQWLRGRVIRGGNVYNDWGGGPGGHEGARAYRERTMRHVDEEATQAATVPANVTEVQPP